MVSRLWTRFGDSGYERSRPRSDNILPRNFSGRLELVVVSKTAILEQPSVTLDQQGTHEKRDEVLSKVVAQKGLETSGYQVFTDLDDAEFSWENDQLDVDAVFRPGVDTPSSPTAFDDLEMGGSAENPILLNEQEDKENYPPPLTTPVCE